MTDTINSKKPANSAQPATPIAPVEQPQAPLPKQPKSGLSARLYSWSRDRSAPDWTIRQSLSRQ
jgi:hypothetical protein